MLLSIKMHQKIIKKHQNASKNHQEAWKGIKKHQNASKNHQGASKCIKKSSRSIKMHQKIIQKHQNASKYHQDASKCIKKSSRSFGEFHPATHGEKWELPSGKHTKSDGKIHHAINGKTHYFNGHVQVRKLLVYKRVFHLDLVSLCC